MTKLNFQQFRIPTGIDKTQYGTGGLRTRRHALAMKIYRSEGAADYTDEEVRTLTEVASSYGTPAFIDGLNEQIDNQPKTD